MTVSELRELLRGIPHQAEIRIVNRTAAEQEDSVLEPEDVGYVSELACYVIWADQIVTQ